MPIVMTAAKVAGGLLVLGTGNIVVLMGIGYWFFVKKKAPEA